MPPPTEVKLKIAEQNKQMELIDLVNRALTYQKRVHDISKNERQCDRFIALTVLLISYRCTILTVYARFLPVLFVSLHTLTRTCPGWLWLFTGLKRINPLSDFGQLAEEFNQQYQVLSKGS